jgi:excisionase family DNA binding protein
LFLTIQEIMTEYKVSHTTILNWIKRGLPATKIGRLLRIKEDDLKRFISSQNTRDKSAQESGDTEK